MGNLEPIEQLRKDYPQYEDQRFHLKDEMPAHKVRITKPFYMGAYAVTLGQFRKFVEAAHYLTDAERNDEHLQPAGQRSRAAAGRLRLQHGDGQAGRATATPRSIGGTWASRRPTVTP